MTKQDDLLFRLRGPHINWMMVALHGNIRGLADEGIKLRDLCLEAADEIERLRRKRESDTDAETCSQI